MVDVRQLKLNLGLAIEEATEVPEEVDVLELWQQFEIMMPALPRHEQLRLGAEVLVQLSGICEAKADILWEDWQDAHNAEGPVLDGDWLRGLTRQTQEIDFSELVQSTNNVRKDRQEKVAEDDSVIREVNKEAILALLDELESEEAKAKALAVSHVENVSAWIENLFSRRQSFPQRLLDLQQQLQMPLVEVWIAALVGGFSLEQRGDFYDAEQIWLR